MIIINTAILCLALYEIIPLIKKGLKKEVIVYSLMLILVIITEVLALGITERKSLAILILDAIGIKY